MPKSRRNQSPKKWGHGLSKRRVDKLDPKQRFLIVCEGEKTEPYYFRSFRVPRKVVEVKVEGAGRHTISVVKRAIELKDDDDYDQVWCVFDRNSHPAQYFNDALTLAHRNGIEVAYSNQSFELWYLLHFYYCDTAVDRADCLDRLSRALGYEYKKNSETIYDDLKHLQHQAIQRAERLLSQYDPPNPESNNPSTTVHLLVKQLNRFIL